MNTQVPQDLTWSYSKLTTYEHCPLAFKLHYLDGLPKTNNAYAEFGSLCHSLIERWVAGSLAEFELGAQYRREYEQAVIHPFPPYPKGLGGRYFDAGAAYFDSFAGFSNNMEIIAAEERFQTKLDGHPFIGIADLLLRDTDSGELILMDHKSKSLPSMKKVLRKQLRQLYLYAAFIKEKYGEYPARLVLNLFREPAYIDTPFAKDEFDASMNWAVTTIDQIYAEEDWRPCKLDYFCQFLCDEAYNCPLFMGEA